MQLLAVRRQLTPVTKVRVSQLAMLIWILIVLNIPVFLFLGLLAFNTTHGAADTFFGTIVTVLKISFIPWWIRALMGNGRL